VYQIPIGIAKRAMKLTISGDKSQTVMGHQQILLSQTINTEPRVCVQVIWHTFVSPNLMLFLHTPMAFYL
jgi:hypothetical protein